MSLRRYFVHFSILSLFSLISLTSIVVNFWIIIPFYLFISAMWNIRSIVLTFCLRYFQRIAHFYIHFFPSSMWCLMTRFSFYLAFIISFQILLDVHTFFHLSFFFYFTQYLLIFFISHYNVAIIFFFLFNISPCDVFSLSSLLMSSSFQQLR